MKRELFQKATDELEGEGAVGREGFGEGFHQCGLPSIKFLPLMCLFLKSQTPTGSDAGTTALSC